MIVFRVMTFGVFGPLSAVCEEVFFFFFFFFTAGVQLSLNDRPGPMKRASKCFKWNICLIT